MWKVVRGKWCRSEQDLEYHLEKHKANLKTADTSSKDGHTELVCDFCNETFPTKRMIMQHKKAHHTEKALFCWNFSSGKCGFCDDLCWFLHDGGSERSRTEIKCNICEKLFENKNNFMHHKKIEHAKNVQMCTNMKSCHYQNCWFHHEPCHDQNDEEKEVTEKMLSMMEKFTQRIVNLEKLIKK